MEADGTLLPGIVAGVLFAVEFLLIYRGLVWTTASRASVFLYSAPFFVVIGARWFIPGDRFDPLQWLGLLLSFAGLVVAFGVPTPGGEPREWIGDIMLLVAGAAWGATTLVIKATNLASAPSEKILLYQLIISAPILALGAHLSGERVLAPPSALAVGSLLYQTVWVVALTYIAWFALIQRYSASRLSAFTLSHAAVRNRRRAPHAWGSPDGSVCGGGRAGSAGPHSRQPTTLTWHVDMAR
jgi:drug/metabolite transporter (DMT)-like permease